MPGGVAVRVPFWLPLLCAALIFPLLPGHPLAPLPGLPLDGLSLAALGAIAILFFGWTPGQPSRRDRYLLGALLILCLAKLGTHAASLDYGLRANYYTLMPDGTISASAERSVDFPDLGATRLDRSLALDARNLPVYFWNDLRFNFWRPDEPVRSNLPLRIEWSGYLYAPETADYSLRLSSDGLARVMIGGADLSVPNAGDNLTQLKLEQGTHQLLAEYVRPANGTGARFELAWATGTSFAPVSAPYILPSPTVPSRWVVGHWAQLAATFLAGLYGIVLSALALRLIAEWLGRLSVRPEIPVKRRRRAEPAASAPPATGLWERPLLALVLLLGLGWALFEARPYGERTWLFAGGEDWLTYESHARDIVLNGPLLLEGKPIGGARPLWEQPAYPYVLAGLHLVAGEPLYGPILLQLAALPLEALLIYFIGRRLFSPAAAATGMALFGFLAVLDFKRTALLLLTENLFQLLLPLVVLTLLAVVTAPRTRRAVGSGALVGLLVVTRFSALVYAPIALAATWLALRTRVGRGRASLTVLLIVSSAVAIVALVPLRNLVAAGTPTLMPTSSAGNLMVDRQLPTAVDLGQVEVGPLAPVYQAVHLTRVSPEAQALEYLRQDPAGFVGSSLHFLAYALGIAGMRGDGPHLEFLPIVALYLVAWLAWRETGRSECWLVHGFVLTHLAVLALFGINEYPPRTVLPMYVLMPAVSGFGATVAAQRLVALFGGVNAGVAAAPARARVRKG